MLQAYARDNHMGNTKFYVDDGYTGTNFNRPGFQELLDDIEMGYVGTIKSIFWNTCIAERLFQQSLGIKSHGFVRLLRHYQHPNHSFSSKYHLFEY